MYKSYLQIKGRYTIGESNPTGSPCRIFVGTTETDESCTVVLLLAAACVGLYFVGNRAFYIGLSVSALILLFVAYKTKITDFLQPREHKGEITYFTVRTEMVKKNLGTNWGETYNTFRADMTVTDADNKTRYKTFPYNPEYNYFEKGDTVTIFRFVDYPVTDKKQ